MVSSIVNNTVQGETFLPGQIFVFGGFALRANSLGRMEKIDSFALGHKIRFGDLSFDGFKPAPGTPDSHDEHGLDRSSDNARDITHASAPVLNPEQVALPKDGGMDPAPWAAYSSAVEPNTGLTSVEACNPGPSDSYPVVGSGLHTLKPGEPGWAPVMEFTTADIFSALALWRHAELIKVSLFVRRL